MTQTRVPETQIKPPTASGHVLLHAFAGAVDWESYDQLGLLGSATAASAYVSKSGDTMTGQLTVNPGVIASAYPVASGQLTHKAYVDSAIAASAVGLSSGTIASAYLRLADAASAYITLTAAASAYPKFSAVASAYITLSDTASAYTSKTDAASAYVSLTDAASAYIAKEFFNAKGDLITATADNTPAILSAGVNLKVLSADSAVAAGVKWDYPVPLGAMFDTASTTLPTGYKWCDGSAILRTTYADAFAAMCPSKGTATVTLASAGVFTNTAHGLDIGDPVFLTTTGALPTGMSPNTTYYVMTIPSANTFTLGTTRSVTDKTGAISVTTAVNTSVSQSGVHTLYWAPWGISSSTTFNLPDFRARQSMAPDDLGGTDAARIGAANTIGLPWGENTHPISHDEMPVHTHNFYTGGTYATGWATFFIANTGPTSIGAMGTATTAVTYGATSTASGAVHNNVQLVLQCSKIIFVGV